MEERLLAAEEEESKDLKWRICLESKKLWMVAFPTMVSRVSQFSMLVVTQAFIGHSGELQLAAYALVQIIAVRFAQGILAGMSSATETLCAQAFGAAQHHMLGVYLQRSLIINLGTTTILLLPIFLFSGQIFKLLGEETTLAAAAGYMSLWFIPIVYFFAIHLTVQKYLQAQTKNRIVGWLAVLSLALHVLLSWTFVSKLGLGIPGAMGSLILSSWLVIVGEFVYVFGGWCPHTWKGFSFAAFSDLLPVMKLSISSGLMLCLETWYFAVLILVVGFLSNAAIEISAFSICLNVTYFYLMICMGFLVAASVRVGNELGRGHVEAAKFSVNINCITSFSFGMISSILYLVFGDKIAYLFTSEEQVVQIVSSLSVLVACTMLLYSIPAVLSGVAIGCGRQATVAYFNICSYYVIGVPIGVVLAFLVHLGVKGMWIGMLIGIVVQSLVLYYLTWRTDWNEQVERASERLNRWLLRSTE